MACGRLPSRPNLEHLKKQAKRGDREIVESLLDAGADPTLEDGTFKSTPAGWADYFGKPEIAELIRSRS